MICIVNLIIIGNKAKTIPDKIYCQLIDKKKINFYVKYKLTYQLIAG